MKRARLLKVRLRVSDEEGLTATEAMDWVSRGFQERCGFEHTEIEFNTEDQDEVGHIFMCYVITNMGSKRDPVAVIESVMFEFCEFSHVIAYVERDVQNVWVNDDFTLPESC